MKINKAKYQAKVKDMEEIAATGLLVTAFILFSPLLLIFFIVGLVAKTFQKLYLGSIEWWLKDE